MNQTPLKPSELLDLFLAFCAASGFSAERCRANDTLSHFMDFSLVGRQLKFEITLNLRNISSAYLPYDPSVQRRQVSALQSERLPKNTKTHLTLLGGIYAKGDEPIFAVWNPFLFCDHRTVRSCYISKGALDQTASTGYVKSFYSSTPVYSCTKGNLSRLLENYCSENAID